MAMIIKAKDPVTKSNKGITSTKIEGTGEDPDRQGLDVNIANLDGVNVTITNAYVVKPARKEQLDETDISDGVVTFSTAMTGIEVYNDSETNDLTYTINGIIIIVPARESDTGLYDSFTEVTVAGTSPNFRMIGLN